MIEGDQQTANDADRIRETGVQAIQINTGKGCHLDAHMVGHAMENFSGMTGGVLFIENVGNLVCPASFDLGEAAKVSILSVTEGEDKPLKYPDMFHASELMILNKTDCYCRIWILMSRNALSTLERVNPDIHVLFSCQPKVVRACRSGWIGSTPNGQPSSSLVFIFYNSR